MADFVKDYIMSPFVLFLLNLWYIYWKGTAWTRICPDLLQRWKMAKFVQTFFKVNRWLWGIQTSCWKVIRRNKDRWLLLPAQNTKHGILKTKTQNTKIMLQIHCYIVFPHNISIASPGALISIPTRLASGCRSSPPTRRSSTLPRVPMSRRRRGPGTRSSWPTTLKPELGGRS